MNETLLKKLAKPMLILAPVIWGSSFVVMKSSVDVLPTFWLLAIRFSFAALVLAVGAAPAVPPVPGIDSPKVIDCVTALTGPDLPGQRVLVVGGGLVGCETALGYAQAGKQVTILEALPDILSAGIPVPEMNDSMLRDLLDEAGVVRRTGRRLSRVTEDGAVADGPDGEEKLPADHIVLAVGFTPRTSLAPELAGAGMEVYQVGDGSRVGSVMTAIGSAYTVGRML